MTIPAGLTWRPEFRPQQEDGPESSRGGSKTAAPPSNPNSSTQTDPNKKGKQGAPQGCFDTEMLPMLLLMVGVFYFFLIRPQQKQEKQLKTMRSTLKKGDEVVTTGGMHGIVHLVDGNTIQLRTSEGGPILTFDSTAIGRVATDEAAEEGKQPDVGKDGK